MKAAQKMKATLYQFETSPFCSKVRKILDYKGLDLSDRRGRLRRAQRIDRGLGADSWCLR